MFAWNQYPVYQSKSDMGYMSIDRNYIPLFNLHFEALDFFNVQAAKFRHIESIFKGNLA